MLSLWIIGFCSFLAVNTALCDDIQQDVNSNGAQAWPWKKKDDKFKCPSSFGAFPDEEDCQHFFVCFASIFSRKKCPPLYRFDKNHRVCMPMLIARCEEGQNTDEVPTDEEDVTTATQKEQTVEEVSTTAEDIITSTVRERFFCTRMTGLFPHPTDCRQYYSCTFFMSTLRACQENELFDSEKKKCLPENEVDCGERNRPDGTTESVTLTSSEKDDDDATSATEIEEQPVTTASVTDLEETTQPPTVAPETPRPPTVAPETTVSPTPEEETTTEKVPVTAPDTTCREDDVECIIDDLGETPDWFTCPADVGGHPHPSSKKLFIFCLNWRPSVKRCGQDLIFSEKLLTCVSP